MNFTQEPALRLACLVFVVAAASSCELPIAQPGADQPAAQLVVAPKTVTLSPDQLQDFTAVGLTASGDTALVAVTWSATGGNVDTSSSGGRHYAHYQNVNCGDYTLAATSHPGNLSDTAHITISCLAAVATVTVSPAMASVPVGRTVQLSATPKDDSGNPLSGRTVTWASSDTTIAKVNGNGLVTGKAAGSATITAMSEGKSGTSAITVINVPVASVTVTPSSASGQVGQTVQLTATPRDASGNPLSGRAVTWSSSDTTVATVSRTGFVTAKGAGTATITATSEGKSGTATITVTSAPVPVASVTVTPSSASVPVGQTVQLSATPKDANGSPLSGRVVTWASDDTTIARVSGSGLVTGRGAGSATITATSEGKSGTATITVTSVPVPVASVTVTPSSASVPVGQTVQLSATPKDANGSPLSGRGVTWASDDTTIARVSGSGLVTGRGAGSATITATSEGKSGTATIMVTSVPVPVASVTVTPSSASGQVGQTVQLTATPKDASGNPLSGRAVTWSSSDTAIATVSGTGFVTAKAAGTATITATSEGKSGTATITVMSVPVPVASVTVTPSSASVPVGQTVQLTATPKDAGGNPLSGRAVTWSSSDTAIATVNASGRVTAKAAGSATITAASEGKSGTSAITVPPPSGGGGARFGHVFIVTEENTNYADAIGNASMPYLNSLAQQYGLATQYYANTHPSIGNYFELATGQVLTNNDGSSTIQNVPNVVRSLLAAGKTWKSYAESIPSACYLGGDTGDYARKHNVFGLLSDVANDPTGQACNIVPFTQFATDLANGTLPSFSNIAPNLCNDAHDCSLGTADAWLRANIDPLIRSATFQQDGLLIIVFDEAGGDNTNGGGKVAWVAVSPKSKPGYQSATLYQHPSTLRLMLKGLGVTTFPGAAASAPDMDEFFTP